MAVNKTKTNYAGFLIRMLAGIADRLIIWFFVFLVLLLFNFGDKNIPETIVSLGWFTGLFILISLFLPVLYTSFLTYRYGGTPGKLISGLAVTDEKGENLSFSKSLFRNYIGYPVSSLLCGLGFLAIIKNPQKQGWHDQLCGSYVIHKRTNGLIAVIVFCFIMLILNLLIALKVVNQVIYNRTLRNDIVNVKELFQPKQIRPENWKNQINLSPSRTPYYWDEVVSPYPQL